jgi:outer membrane cobalamin receptor
MKFTVGQIVRVLAFVLLTTAGVLAQEVPTPPLAPQTLNPASPVAEAPTDKKYTGTTEVTVVAPPILQSQKATEQGTTVVTVGSQQIEDLNAQDLAESLRRVPGVVISRYNPIGSYGGAEGGAIYIRGHGTGRPGAEIATMIDGIPIFSGVWTHPLLDLLPVDMARSIDVYKSPEPVLFGNMAFGVVNLVPKSVQEPGQPGRAEFQYGSFDTKILVAEQGGKSGAVDYYVEGSLKESDGHRPDADGRVGSAYGRLGFDLSPHWTLGFQVHYTDSWGDDPGQVGVPLPPVTQRFSVTDTLAIATLSNRYDNASGFIKVYDNDGNIDWLQWDGGAGQPFHGLTSYQTYGVKIQERWQPWAGAQLVAGFDHNAVSGSYEEKRVASTYNFPNRTLNDDAPYLLLSQDFGKEVVVTPAIGVRYDASGSFENEWGGQAGVNVRWGTNRAHAGISRTFNYPGLYTAVMYDQMGQGKTWQHLQAEIDQHAEIGYGVSLPHGIDLDLTYFYDRVTRALRFVPPPPFPPSFANLGDYTLRGGELEARFSPTKSFSAFLGGAYNSSIPEDVPDTPRWTWTGGLVVIPAPRWRISADAQYVDKHVVLNPRFPGMPQEVGAYFLLNAKVSFAVTSPKCPVIGEVFLAGENLTDRSFEFQPGYPMPGPSGMIGLNLRW